MIFTSIDLELNKENGHTTDIIQIGATIGNIYTGEILEKLRLYVKIDKPLSPYIITLTGITEQDLLDKGTSLLQAYSTLRAAHIKHNCQKMPIQWGGGDERCLKEQLLTKNMPEDAWIFGYCSWNTKQMCQEILLSKNKSIQGGLKKNCSRFGIPFEGPAHDALNDSLNTFKLFCSLLKKYEKLNFLPE